MHFLEKALKKRLREIPMVLIVQLPGVIRQVNSLIYARRLVFKQITRVGIYLGMSYLF
ncbi:MAG: hypothetical protein MUO64_08665 [Anaerolineales bacterium]|nr:hypothetical protein [Anaerolineales bacterium]